jgi:hypothetical protein
MSGGTAFVLLLLDRWTEDFSFSCSMSIGREPLRLWPFDFFKQWSPPSFSSLISCLVKLFDDETQTDNPSKIKQGKRKRKVNLLFK